MVSLACNIIIRKNQPKINAEFNEALKWHICTSLIRFGFKTSKPDISYENFLGNTPHIPKFLLYLIMVETIWRALCCKATRNNMSKSMTPNFIVMHHLRGQTCDKFEENIHEHSVFNTDNNLRPWSCPTFVVVKIIHSYFFRIYKSASAKNIIYLLNILGVRN